MNLQASSAFWATALAVISATAVLADDAQSRRDNSGRQIAIVVPGVPKAMPVAPVGVMSTQTSKVGGTATGKGERQSGRSSRTLSSVATPAELSPEIRQAIEKGTVWAQGFCRIATSKAGDMAAWAGTIWRQCNEMPLITPAREFTAPPVGSMRPIAEPGRERRLYFTSERRLKTVVGQ